MSNMQLLCLAFLVPGRFREIEAWQHTAEVHSSTQLKVLRMGLLEHLSPPPPPPLIKVSFEEFLWEP